MATSAAPTYFPAYASSWNSIYVDGGLWANNPAYLGLFEATHVLGATHERVRILNLGTGVPRAGAGTIPWKERLGIVGWAAGVTDLILDANALAVAGMTEHACGENFVRVAPDVGHEQLPLDHYSPRQLLALAEERARFAAGAADVFFQHDAPRYAKCRSETVSAEVTR